MARHSQQQTNQSESYDLFQEKEEYKRRCLTLNAQVNNLRHELEKSNALIQSRANLVELASMAGLLNLKILQDEEEIKEMVVCLVRDRLKSLLASEESTQ